MTFLLPPTFPYFPIIFPLNLPPMSAASRRHFLKTAGLSLAALPVAASAYGALFQEKEYLVYVGTNVAGADQDTIFLYRLHPVTGQLTPVRGQRGGIQPTYLTLDQQRRFLYAVSETTEFRGAPSGGVSTFRIDPKTGDLTLLGQQASGGGAPCYLSLDHTGKAALVANYGGGNVSLLPIQPNGQLAAAAALDQHQGTGPHPNQTGPHAHCLLPAPDNRFAFAVDLGTDTVYCYELRSAQGQLTRTATPAFTTKPGAGPRHLTFHPNGRLAYLINELNSTLTALAYDTATGSLRELQTLSTLPAGFTQNNSCADVHVSPDGKFVYGSNRGHDSIVVFRIDAKTGQLTLVQHVSTQGKTPRNFSLDPAGRLLLVANQNSNTLVTYHVDRRTGQLTPTGHTATVPTPMIVQIVSDFSR